MDTSEFFFKADIFTFAASTQENADVFRHAISLRYSETFKVLAHFYVCIHH